MNISGVVPVYNGQDTLLELLERLGKVLPGISDSYEVILVCEGSPDNSGQVIEKLVVHHPWVTGIQLMRKKDVPKLVAQCRFGADQTSGGIYDGYPRHS
jgi:glycosyltransferase involved in cell wall biosynthesis